MKFYIGYRYTGADKEKLKQFLQSVSSILESKNHNTFMYFRDGGNWEKKEGKIPLDQVIQESFKQIANSDYALFLIQSNEFSEGMLLDIGCAVANNIPIILCKHQGTSLPKTESLAYKIIEYSDEADLMAQISKI